MRYFFHMHHRQTRPDRKGVEFASDAEAWKQGTQACGEMMKGLDGRIAIGPEYRMECVDENDRFVSEVCFFARAELA